MGIQDSFDIVIASESLDREIYLCIEKFIEENQEYRVCSRRVNDSDSFQVAFTPTYREISFRSDSHHYHPSSFEYGILFRVLLSDLHKVLMDKFLSDSRRKQWDEDLVQSLIVRQDGELVTVESWQQKDGTRLWGIYTSIYVMSKEDGLFYPDLSPSNRPDNYYELFRWDSAQEAFDFATKMLERNDAIAEQEIKND